MKRFDPGAEENGTDLSINLPGVPTGPTTTAPSVARSNTVRGLTLEAEIDPKLLQQSAANERTD